MQSKTTNQDVEYEDKVERFEMKINESTRLLYSTIKDMNKVYHNDFLLCLIGHYLTVHPNKLDLIKSNLSASLESKPDSERKLSISNAAINSIANLKIPPVYPQVIIDDIITAIKHIVATNPAIDISGIPQSIYKGIVSDVVYDTHTTSITPVFNLQSDSSLIVDVDKDIIQTSPLPPFNESPRLPLSVTKFNDISLNAALKAELLKVLDFADYEIPDNTFEYYNTDYNIIKVRIDDIVARLDLSKNKHESAVAKIQLDLSNLIKSFNIELTHVLQQYCHNREVVENFLCSNPKTLERYLDARFNSDNNVYTEYKSDKSIWSLSLSQINTICDALTPYQVKADFVISASTIHSPQVKLKSAIGSAYGFIFKDKPTTYEFTSF